MIGKVFHLSPEKQFFIFRLSKERTGLNSFRQQTAMEKSTCSLADQYDISLSSFFTQLP
jgi:hypothetical protein